MRLVSTIMWFSPIGIASLIAGKILQLENVGGTLQSLALFTGTVIGGQTFHLLVSLPLIFFLLTRQNPYRFMRGLIQAWTTALGTASRYGFWCFKMFHFTPILRNFSFEQLSLNWLWVWSNIERTRYMSEIQTELARSSSKLTSSVQCRLVWS